MEILLHKDLSSLIKLVLVTIVLSISLSADAQSDKSDYVWLFSNNSSSSPGNEAYGFDFNEKGPAFNKPYQSIIPIEFTGNNASICDKEGNLLYYTNGCHVVGRNHNILPNGSDLNYGEWITEFRGDTCASYPTTQDILILPDPGNENNHYIIHKPIEIGDPRFKSLRYSYIDGSMNNGQGDITKKGIHIIPDKKFLYSYLTAVPHENNNDWWVIQIDDEEIIYSVLLDSDGFTSVVETKMPTEFVENSSATGKPKFSPDGTKYAFYNPYDDLHLYDFDRGTGELSNHRYLLIEEFPDDRARFSSVEWSPNSRFVYITIQDQLWQIDTWEEDLADGLELIDTWNGESDPFPTLFFLMALAPDCKIYICSFSSTNSYHVINNPNEKGQACDFVQQGIRLPFVSASATMPNFPRFRVDEEEKCDPTITSVFGDDIYWRRDLIAYPNPVRDKLSVELPEGEQGHIYVFDMNGQLVWESAEFYSEQKVFIDMSGYQTGSYNVEFIPEKNKERRIWTSKIVKVE